MTRKTHLVVTTIYEPAWLGGYLENLRRYDRRESVRLSIIIDRKTPASVAAAAAQARQEGFDVWCPSLDEQVSYLRRLGAADDLVPWNSDNRRNIGFLHALEERADVLISIDDDNYCPQDVDFVGAHHVVGSKLASVPAQFAEGAAWYNICELLEAQTKAPFFARGYPYSAKLQPSASLSPAAPLDLGERVLAINAGLWTDDPDVDALTRLAIGPRVSAAGGPVLLSQPTWSPINTQNTALIGDAMVAYYYVRMGYALQGLRIDRFGDILSGYFVQKCAKHLGQFVRFGDPVAGHHRSSHNLFKDLYFELAGVVLVEELLPWLQEVTLTGSSYAEVYASLVEALRSEAPKFKGFVWDEGGREFLMDTAACMEQWLKLTRRFL